MTIKYLSEKELMKIPADFGANQRIEEINKKYPILRELEEKLNYEQFVNLFFLVDRLYCYQLMWGELKKGKYQLIEFTKDGYFSDNHSLNDIEQKYFPKPSDNFTEKVMEKINKEVDNDKTEIS